jgi:hypothetical protein
MAQAAIRLKTRVLPGNRIEVTAPELIEGADVEVFVALPEDAPCAESQEPRIFASAIDYLNSLPPIERTAEEWAQVEREIEEERNSWER